MIQLECDASLEDMNNGNITDEQHIGNSKHYEAQMQLIDKEIKKIGGAMLSTSVSKRIEELKCRHRVIMLDWDASIKDRVAGVITHATHGNNIVNFAAELKEIETEIKALEDGKTSKEQVKEYSFFVQVKAFFKGIFS